MTPIVIITARGESRRLPRKNVLPFCGKPLVEWTILQARCARCLTEDDIYLSTDDDEIAEIGARNHIHVIRRPDWPDADRLGATPVVRHAIGIIEADQLVTHLFHLLPTSPCRHPEDIDQVWQAYLRLKREHPGCQRVLSVAPQRETVVWRREGLRVRVATWDKHFGYFSQGPSTSVFEIAWWRRWGNLLYHDGDEFRYWRNRRLMKHPWHYVVAKWYQGVDVDDRDTFELNEVLMERYILQGRGDAVYWDYKAGGEDDERVERDECAAAR